MEWWDKVVLLIRRIWTFIATRLGIRKSGGRGLLKHVRRCEYKDVHVMWEMLKKSERDLLAGTAAAKKQRKRYDDGPPELLPSALRTF